MVKSIFEIENRLDIQKEFEKFIKVLHENYSLLKTNYLVGYKAVSYVELIDEVVFKK